MQMRKKKKEKKQDNCVIFFIRVEVRLTNSLMFVALVRFQI